MTTSTAPKRSREACVRAAAAAVNASRARQDARTPAQAAAAAYTPGGPSVAELEQRIIAARAAQNVQVA